MSVATLSRTSDGLRDVCGRGMNVHSDVYKLPADAEEHDRLTLQHRIWKLMYGGTGLYPPEVEDIIQRLLSSDHTGSGENASPPSVLDLGSGSGIWVAEMAAKYPHAKIVGLDLAEPKLQKSLFPSNCSFVTTDLTKGLDAYRESFDVVHCRCVAGHVVDRLQLIQEIVKVLKPGGLLLLADGNLHLYQTDGSLVPAATSESTLQFSSRRDSSYSPQPNGDEPAVLRSWISHWLSQVIGRVISATLDPEHGGGEHLGWLIRQESQMDYLDERAYLSPLRLKRRSGEDEGRQEREREEELTKLMVRNISTYLTASKPILLGAGIPEDTVNDWLTRARAEIHEQSDATETWSMKWDMAWAVKRSTHKLEGANGGRS